MRYTILRSARKDAVFITKDLLVVSWFFTTPQTLDPEIDAVFWRNQIEEDKFKLVFFEDLNEKSYLKYTDKEYYSKEENKFNMETYKRELREFEDRLRD